MTGEWTAKSTSNATCTAFRVDGCCQCPPSRQIISLKDQTTQWFLIVLGVFRSDATEMRFLVSVFEHVIPVSTPNLFVKGEVLG